MPYSWVFVHLSKLISAAVLALAGTAAFAQTPQRVVSTNACADQLAMLVAAEGQLVSVSSLAADPRISAMHKEAAKLVLNTGRAEEIYLMKPDVVLAGTYTARASIDMLERLGVSVVTIAPAQTLEDIPERLLQVGKAMGREARARELTKAYEARLKALSAQPVGHKPRAALYGANGFTTGPQALSGQILAAAGYDNIATEHGIAFGRKLPVELLVMSAPDIVISGTPYEGYSRSEEIPEHPAVRAMTHAQTVVTSNRLSCGTPYVLDAIEELVAARRKAEQP